MPATILFSDRETLKRLELEGGLRSSFFGVFEGSIFETADDTPHGDGVGLDDLLEDKRIVAVNETLLAPDKGELPDRQERERYRHNFVRKCASREHIWLTVIDGEGAAQADALRHLRGRLEGVLDECGKDAPRRAVLVLVFTRPMSSETLKSLRALRNEQYGIARVYVMSDRLQPAEKHSRAMTALAVWPICVARLLVARVLMSEAKGGGPPSKAEMFAWRTLACGALSGSSWLPVYRSMLRNCLWPNKDREAEQIEPFCVGVAPEGLVGAVPTQNPRDFQWQTPAEDIEQAGLASIDDDVFEGLLRRSGEYSLKGRALEEGIERVKSVEAQATENWGQVAEPDKGLTWLQRLTSGRLWSRSNLPDQIDRQRTDWDHLTATRRQIDIAREHHRDAVEQLALARSRHLSLLWRVIIAAVVMVFLGQFLAAVLIPLRPDNSFVPRSSAGFLGTPTASARSVAFLVDCSGSMAGERIDLLRTELQSAIEGLDADTPFSIVTFRHVTTDEMCLPGATDALVPASAQAKDEATRWVEANVKADGGTDPSDGLRRILAMDPAPASIVLLTDGVFANPEAVRQAIVEAEARCKDRGAKVSKIHTVALWQREEEPFLKAIAERTGADYRVIEFDLFAPLGFSRVVTILLIAGALGVAFGALVPYWLEVWRGRKGVAAVRGSLAGLIKEFCHLTHEMQVLFQGAYQSWSMYRTNSAGDHQRDLAIRAFDEVDSCVSRERDAQSGRSGSRGTQVGALEGEDRRDLVDCLDVGIRDGQMEPDRDRIEEALKERAKSHADDVNKEWSNLCEELDRNRSGHLPAHAIKTRLGTLLDRKCDEAALELLSDQLPREGTQGAEKNRCLEDLVSRSKYADAAPGGMSVQTTRIGRVPDPERYAFFIDKDKLTGEHARAFVSAVDSGYREQMRLKLRMSQHEPDLGLVCLGLVHEEVPLDFRDGSAGPELAFESRGNG